jgi:hypothetical protein
MYSKPGAVMKTICLSYNKLDFFSLNFSAKIHMKNLLFVLFIIPFSIAGQPKAGDIKKGIVGLWRFNHIYTKKSPIGQTDDACLKAMTYLFKEDGSVSVENTGKPACQYGNYIMQWGIIKLHDEKGKERFAIRLTEERIAERESYDGNTFNDEIFMIMSLGENYFTWIPKPQYTRPSAKAEQHWYQKIN